MQTATGAGRHPVAGRRGRHRSAVLAAIDVLVVYFTMQICGLTAADLNLLPKAPLLAFFLVQNGGYLVAFTAGGQTLGKMAMGIKVVSTATASSVESRHSLLRTALWLLLAIPAGLGFLTALFSGDRRGLHDRFAGTRVVARLAVKRPVVALSLATAFGVGYVPFAPGTFGSAAGLLLWCAASGVASAQAAAIVATVRRRRRGAAASPSATSAAPIPARS